MNIGNHLEFSSIIAKRGKLIGIYLMSITYSGNKCKKIYRSTLDSNEDGEIDSISDISDWFFLKRYPRWIFPNSGFSDSIVHFKAVKGNMVLLSS